MIYSVPLCCLTYSNTFPLVMKGIMSRGISPSIHSPVRGITLGWLNESMIDTSLSSLSLSATDCKAEDRVE